MGHERKELAENATDIAGILEFLGNGNQALGGFVGGQKSVFVARVEEA